MFEALIVFVYFYFEQHSKVLMNFLAKTQQKK